MLPSSAHVPRRPLIVATGNPGKLLEFRALLADLPFDLHSLGELGIASPEETGASFMENALLKARHAAAAATSSAAGLRDAGSSGTAARGFAAIADDSGLEVAALGGAPGIFSARFAGPAADDDANNAKLLSALAGVAGEQRCARYRCVLAFVAGAEDPAPLIAEGVWEGVILDAPRGSGGFGYDPYFWLPELGATAAELAPEEKNRLSHRGIAMRALRDLLAARERRSTADQPAGDPYAARRRGGAAESCAAHEQGREDSQPAADQPTADQPRGRP
jgi:XTP/dITP diphosphohydrolase